jgi:toxin ParE1/3/4
LKVEFSRKAASDRLAHWQYVGQFSWSAANRIDDTILGYVKMLGEHPHLGRVGRVAGTRELFMGKTSLIAVYAIEDEVVVVKRLLHAAQNWPARF